MYDEYLFLNQLIKDNYPNVAALEKQISPDDFSTLKKLFNVKNGLDLLKRVLASIENKKDIQKKYNSVFLTIVSFIKMEKVDEDIIRLRETWPKRKQLMQTI
jgi:hypothetical protein